MRRTARVMLTSCLLPVLVSCSSGSGAPGRVPAAAPPRAVEATFSEADLSAILPPDTSQWLGTPDAGSDPLTSDLHLVDCAQLAAWLGRSIAAVSGYTTTCGTCSREQGLPQRHATTTPTGGEYEYTVEVEYAPTGVDVTTMPASEAFGHGAVAVGLRYDQHSWDGSGYPATTTVSDPTDLKDGGYVYGRIDGRTAVVQAGPRDDTMLSTTVTAGGNVFSVVMTSKLSPRKTIAFAAEHVLA